MQRALLEASLAYSNTVNNHKLLYNGYEIRDPRSEYEKEKQKKVKQQLIEKNLESMHLFEQKQGKVLHFHLWTIPYKILCSPIYIQILTQNKIN